MPRDPRVLLYVGIKNSVVALDDRTGDIVWRVELRSSDFVNVLWDGEALFVSNAGEVWRLDPEQGTVIWRNELKGLGRGLAMLASSRSPGRQPGLELAAEKRRRDAQAAAAAG
jgi:outer membrane protein assembly factor BamB